MCRRALQPDSLCVYCRFCVCFLRMLHSCAVDRSLCACDQPGSSAQPGVPGCTLLLLLPLLCTLSMLAIPIQALIHLVLIPPRR